MEDKRREGRTFEIREDSLTGSDNHPVINVSWHDAQAYCNWLNEQIMTGRVVVDASIGKHIHSGQWRIMLLSELEWEKAARGQQPNTIFSWGNTPDPNRANYDATKINGTSSVGCFAPNDFGCYDLLGNVLEWTRSQYQPYPYRADDGRESPNGERYAVRGGSWSLYVRHARCACRYGNTPGNRNYNLGVRIVVSPISSLTPLGPVASGR